MKDVIVTVKLRVQDCFDMVDLMQTPFYFYNGLIEHEHDEIIDFKDSSQPTTEGLIEVDEDNPLKGKGFI